MSRKTMKKLIAFSWMIGSSALLEYRLMKRTT